MIMKMENWKEGWLDFGVSCPAIISRFELSYFRNACLNNT